jgi:hypothetical protein
MKGGVWRRSSRDGMGWDRWVGQGGGKDEMR